MVDVPKRCVERFIWNNELKNNGTVLHSEILSSFGFTVGVFTLEEKLNECYSVCVSVLSLMPSNIDIEYF